MNYLCLRSCLVALLLLVLLSGCAGLQSRREPDPEQVRGVTYYMPMRYFQLTVTKASRAVTQLEWAASDPFPDLAQTYSLRFDPHWIGKTSVNVVVGTNGLLGTANTKTTDTATELAGVTLASTEKKAKLMRATEEQQDLSKIPCEDDGTFVFLFPAAMNEFETRSVCDGAVTYSIHRTVMTGGQTWGSGQNNAAKIAPGDTSTAGVFYRVNRPFLVSAWSTPSRQVTTKILFVPNESPTVLLPFGRTLFAENDGKITLNNGTVETYQQTDQGELVALLKFPASILGAYFNAIGNVFSAFSNKSTKEAELALKELKLDMLRAQLVKCKEAVDKGDKAAYDTLGCGSLSVPS